MKSLLVEDTPARPTPRERAIGEGSGPARDIELALVARPPQGADAP